MKRFRLDKRKIIKSSCEFNEIFSNGQKVSSQHFLMLAKEAEECKFGFTVSRKIGGSAKRNFAKRRLREIVRLNQEHLPERSHLIFQAKMGIDRADFEELTEEFKLLLKKLKAIKSP